MSEQRDIVERLRANMDKYPGFQNINTEAADEIERLRAELTRLRKIEEAARKMVDQIAQAERDVGDGFDMLARAEWESIRASASSIRTALGEQR